MAGAQPELPLRMRWPGGGAVGASCRMDLRWLARSDNYDFLLSPLQPALYQRAGILTGAYLDRIAAEIRRFAHPGADFSGEELALYRVYAVLLLAKGAAVTAEDVHNAWVAWALEHSPESRHLIPFKELSLGVQEKDERYVDAIRQAAERI